MPLFIDYHEEKVVWSAVYKDEDMGPMMKQVITDIMNGHVDVAGVRYFNIFLAQDGHGCCISEAPDVGAVLRSHELRGMPIRANEVHSISRSLAAVTTIDNDRELRVIRPAPKGIV